MKTLEILSLCLLLGGSLVEATNSSSSSSPADEDSIFARALPGGASVRSLLSQPSIHKPFSYHQEFMADESADYPFSYDLKAPDGPHNWSRMYPSCGGKLQSPINIETRYCKSGKGSIKYLNSAKNPVSVTIENNGYSIGWSFEYDGTRPHLYGGPLTSYYVLETMHLHWGRQKEGSEHWLNGEQKEMELHVIHRNIKYKTFNEATLHKDGLVVIGVLIKGSSKVPRIAMFKNIEDIQMPYSSVTLKVSPKGYRMKNLIDFLDNEKFYTYEGSLTTPPCSETTFWLVGKTVRSVNYDDMRDIRELVKQDYMYMGPNFRPIQNTKHKMQGHKYDYYQKRPCVTYDMDAC